MRESSWHILSNWLKNSNQQLIIKITTTLKISIKLVNLLLQMVTVKGTCTTVKQLSFLREDCRMQTSLCWEKDSTAKRGYAKKTMNKNNRTDKKRKIQKSKKT